MLNQKKYSEIIAYKKGAVGYIMLNREKSLNALSLDMIRIISNSLQLWEKDDEISFIFIEGAGDKAFCAGGDIKNFYSIGMAYRKGRISKDVALMYFKEEYALNQKIYEYSKPIIIFMDGITMGGGYGIAGNSSIRIATEKTKFAMPEVKIGFFPDVGSVYHLSKIFPQFARYLVMTGEAIDGLTMVRNGLADCFISDTNKDEFLLSLSDGKNLEECIDKYKSVTGAPLTYMDEIVEHFSKDGVDGILQSLQSAKSDFSYNTLDCLKKRCPLSVYIALRHLTLADNQSFSDVIARDLRLAEKFIENNNMYVGIRSLLIDKDNQPYWEPESLTKVNDDLVSSFFV